MFIFKRGNYYYVEYLDPKNQKTKRISTGKKSKAGAIQFVSNLSKNINQKIKLKTLSIKQFRSEYYIYAEETYSKKYIRSIKLSFKMFEEFLGDKEIRDISPKDIERFVLHTFRRAPSSSDLYYRTLKAAFNKGLFWGYLSANPFVKVKVPKHISHIPVFMTSKEFNHLLNFVADEVYKEIFITAFYTGMRQAELLNLKWDAIDFKKVELIVKNSDDFTTKSKKERTIPIHDSVLSILKKRRKDNNSIYVFSNKNNFKFHQDTISHKFKKAVRDSNLSDSYNFHSLRKSFASNLAQKGVSLYVIKDLLGHSSIQITEKIYAHLNTESLTNAIKLL